MGFNLRFSTPARAALGLSALMLALLIPIERLQAKVCETDVPLRSDAAQAANGVVGETDFSARFSGAQVVWVKVSNTTVHLTQANVTIVGAGNTICETSIGILPGKSVLFNGAAFGDLIDFSVSVTSGAQDVTQLPVIVYTLRPNLTGTWRSNTVPNVFTVTQSGAGLTASTAGRAYHGNFTGIITFVMTFDKSYNAKVGSDAKHIEWSDGKGTIWTKQ